jgi:hypothetical protein
MVKSKYHLRKGRSGNAFPKISYEKRIADHSDEARDRTSDPDPFLAYHGHAYYA